MIRVFCFLFCFGTSCGGISVAEVTCSSISYSLRRQCGPVFSLSFSDVYVMTFLKKQTARNAWGLWKMGSMSFCQKTICLPTFSLLTILPTNKSYGPILLERQFCYSAFFTFWAGWHASALALPPVDIIFAQLARPLNDANGYLHQEQPTYISMFIERLVGYS